MQCMIKVKPQSCLQQLIVSDFVVCGGSYHTRAQLKCDMRPHKQTRSDTINSCSTHSCGFPIILADIFQVRCAPDSMTQQQYLIARSIFLTLSSLKGKGVSTEEVITKQMRISMISTNCCTWILKKRCNLWPKTYAICHLCLS